jgi:hypothetical protein
MQLNDDLEALNLLNSNGGAHWNFAIQAKPQEMEEVLVFDDQKGFCVGYFSGPAETFFAIVDGGRLSHVTYWMKIPALPGRA